MEPKNIIILATAVAILSTIVAFTVTSKLTSSANNEPIVKLQIRIDQIQDLIDQAKSERIELQQKFEQNSTPDIDQINRLANEASVVEEIELAEDNLPLLQTTPVSDFQQFRQRARNLSEAKKRRLVNAGFAEDEAKWLLQNESDVQLQTLYNDHKAQRQALQGNENPPRVTATQQLRTNIGDEFYERYLRANNQPTTVSVTGVLDSSPGDNAGLQTGDTIVRYAGERIFDVNDLNQLTVQGEVGESVLLEVERDGSQIQLTIPRGPIGISSIPRR